MYYMMCEREVDKSPLLRIINASLEGGGERERDRGEIERGEKKEAEITRKAKRAGVLLFQ